jgi:hypothetical protein
MQSPYISAYLSNHIENSKQVQSPTPNFHEHPEQTPRVQIPKLTDFACPLMKHMHHSLTQSPA